MHYLWHLWPVSNDLKHVKASFSSDSNRSVCLRITQVPRSSKLAIFVLTTMTDIQTDCFTPCACVRGNHIIFLHRWDCNAKEYKDQTQLHPCVATSVNVHEGHTMQQKLLHYNIIVNQPFPQFVHSVHNMMQGHVHWVASSLNNANNIFKNYNLTKPDART